YAAAANGESVDGRHQLLSESERRIQVRLSGFQPRRCGARLRRQVQSRHWISVLIMYVRWLVPIGVGVASVAQIAHATQYLTVEQAQRAAFPDATTFVSMRADFDAAALGAPAGWSPRVWQAGKGDELRGWFF